MRVLHVQKSTGMGGSERYLLELLPGLAELGVEVRMLVLGDGDVGRFTTPLQHAGIDVTLIRAGADVNPLMPWRILREIRRHAPDIVHTHLIHADLYGQIAARLAGVPGVSTFHGSHPFYQRQPHRSAARFAGRLALRTFAVSRHVARFLLETRITEERRIQVVYIGVDPTPSDADHRVRAAARERLGLTDSDIAVGVASRLVPLKGHDFLIQAFGRAREADSRLRLLIAGDGSLQEQLEGMARNTIGGAVQFLGFVEDIASFMTACDVVVLPTLPGFGEGLSVATLEAMAAGRPVVATSVDSLPEIVIPDKTGYLIAPGDVNGLAGALSRLAADQGLRERLGNQARDRVRDVFRVDRMLTETLAVYEDVVRKDAAEGPPP